MSEKITIDLDHNDFSNKIGYRIRHETPINPLLEYAEFMRKKEEHLRQVRNNEIEPMCALGPVEIMQIKDKHGIDVFNLKGNDHKALKYIIETEYPRLKTTNKKVHIKGNGGSASKYHGALNHGS